jgi:hypothetical protein
MDEVDLEDNDCVYEIYNHSRFYNTRDPYYVNSYRGDDEDYR